MNVLVYIAVNLKNGKRYIGITRGSLEERTRRHFCDARRGVKTKFARAIRKYGESIFVFSALEFCPSYESAQKKEIELIAWMKPEYNSTAGGGGAVGYKHTAEAIEKMRQAKLGKQGWSRGKKRPDIAEGARQRLLAKPLKFWLGKRRSSETNAKISATKRGRGFVNPSAKQVAAWRKNAANATKARLARRSATDGNLH